MKTTREHSARYPIRAVSRLTGIGIDTLRAWERRYEAVTPVRDERGRLYSKADIARLRLLHRAVSSGHSIGRVAPLSDAELRRLTAVHISPIAPSFAAPRAALHTSMFNAALMKLDSAAIDHELSRLAAVLPPFELVRDVLLPTLRDVGDTWHRRRGGIAHEHLMSSAMRHLLGSFLRLYSRRECPVRLLFATPSGERHEIGILAAAMLAASHRLAVSYVGPDLPAREIVEAVKAADAKVLVLGFTLTGSGRPKEREVRTILRSLPSNVELWAGGPGTTPYASLLGRRAITLNDFDLYLLQLVRLGGRAS